jgi:hypothetical protein
MFWKESFLLLKMLNNFDLQKGFFFYLKTMFNEESG